ncbi:SpaA isopeptide-forming pilin-related protein [Bifidobacterium aquikefiri]|uniref:SpaA isopeptide-forming pilin-related protein n=1 Tax=Bifidobacterium aquikefiri TaxID=1653207 RepID=UPI0039EBB9D2
MGWLRVVVTRVLLVVSYTDGRSHSVSSRAKVRGAVVEGSSAVSALVLSFLMLLSAVLVVVPVERASADLVELGPDGYFSTLEDGATPVIDNETGTAGSMSATGWANTRRILFGKQGSSGTYDGKQVSGGYKTLGYGGATGIASVPDALFQGMDSAYWKSATTAVAANEAMLWADDVVTSGFAFDTNDTYRNSFDSVTGPYQSNVAVVSNAVGAANYSGFEQGLLRAAPVEGVCTAAQSAGCGSGTYTQQSVSMNNYTVFPLSIGDVRQYLGHDTGYTADANFDCPSSSCANNVTGSWLRSAHWSYSNVAYLLKSDATLGNDYTLAQVFGLRPALRLNLDNLLLSADSSNQSQSVAGDLRLTFVETGRKLDTWSASVTGGTGSRTLSLSGSSNLASQSGLGWKIVDPTTNTVLGPGKTSAGGNVALPESQMTEDSKNYDLYVWGQQDGSSAEGLTNRASEPVKATIRGWQVKTPPSYGIELTGITSGMLKAYKIGGYEDVAFDQAGALKSVKLATPVDPVKASVLAAVQAAGGAGVDADNPAGWVGAHWLGYPTDPLSDDTTSAYSPYAGKLQLFAQELVKLGDAALGGVKGSLAGSDLASAGGTATLTVSGPGVYLIVDNSQASGGSLPIIVGTKAFNEDLGDDGRMVDFVDAGVKGKPRLGVAALKTSVTDVSKRVLNDAGMDGFDVGASVAFEIALRVPDLSGFSSVSYAAYEFKVQDVAGEGLVLPDSSVVRVLMDVPAPDSEVTGGLPGSSIQVAGQSLTVDGLKALFAEDASGHVALKADVPVGSLIRVRYAAVVDADVEYSSPGGGGMHANVNTATLTRSTSESDLETKTATANVYSFEVDLVKVDKDDTSRLLGGAKFEVSRDGQPLKFSKLSDGLYRLDAAGGTELVTRTDGSLTLQGVEARGLQFKETNAPSGYFKVADFTVETLPLWDVDASEVTLASYRTSGTNLAYVSQDGRTVVVADPAHSLANLPYTGGFGVLVLLVVGGLILAFAVRPYYLSHRAETTANILE